MTDTRSQPLFILGMHRSGTSMLARLLQDAGVFIGEHLIGAEVGNQRGHFEDRDIYEFHCAALSRKRDKDWRFFDDGTLGLEHFDYVATDDELSRAKQLIEGRRRQGWWGWKEPRTCLFLDFWTSLIPDARSIVIYRHPLEVHLSHLRRGVNLDLALKPQQALHAYTLYNKKLLSSIATNPSRFLVFNANGGFAQRDLLNQHLSSFLEITQEQVARAGDFHAEEFKTLGLTQEGHNLFALIFPDAARTFDELQSRSAIPNPLPSDPVRDAPIKQWIELLTPVVSKLNAAQREQLLPLLETVLGGSDGLQVHYWKQLLAGAIVAKYTEYREWAEQSIQEQEAYRIHQTTMLEAISAEKDKLGGAIQSEIDRTRKIWDELVNVGKDWHCKVDYIAVLEAEREQLKRRIAELESRAP
ncbi:MAG: sulfotransferase [Verrucomicrobiota bacterium]|nr:sulfotransferase [Verrucomicrobiota bacterium]